jgi:hypothetical protein
VIACQYSERQKAKIFEKEDFKIGKARFLKDLTGSPPGSKPTC